MPRTVRNVREADSLRPEKFGGVRVGCIRERLELKGRVKWVINKQQDTLDFRSHSSG